MTAPVRVLFVCTHNAARSQMAEALLRHLGGSRFEAYSAGTMVTRVHPLAMVVMAERGIDLRGARSKSVTEFAGQPFDYVITVCDQAREACPVFPGATVMRHWSLEDPSTVEGSDAERKTAFERTAVDLEHRLQAFIEETSATRR